MIESDYPLLMGLNGEFIFTNVNVYLNSELTIVYVDVEDHTARHFSLLSFQAISADVFKPIQEGRGTISSK